MQIVGLLGVAGGLLPWPIFERVGPMVDHHASHSRSPPVGSSRPTRWWTGWAINGTAPLFPVDATPGFAIRDLFGAIVLGLIAGLVARGFAWMLRRAKQLAIQSHAVLRTFAAGAVLALLFAAGRLLTGESLLVGSGYSVIAWASTPGRSISLMAAVLALRCLATSTTVAGGGVGGLFIPLVVAGALTGSIVGGAVNAADLTLFIVVGRDSWCRVCSRPSPRTNNEQHGENSSRKAVRRTVDETQQ